MAGKGPVNMIKGDYGVDCTSKSQDQLSPPTFQHCRCPNPWRARGRSEKERERGSERGWESGLVLSWRNPMTSKLIDGVIAHSGLLCTACDSAQLEALQAAGTKNRLQASKQIIADPKHAKTGLMTEM